MKRLKQEITSHIAVNFLVEWIIPLKLFLVHLILFCEKYLFCKIVLCRIHVFDDNQTPIIFGFVPLSLQINLIEAERNTTAPDFNSSPSPQPKPQTKPVVLVVPWGRGRSGHCSKLLHDSLIDHPRSWYKSPKQLVERKSLMRVNKHSPTGRSKRALDKPYPEHVSCTIWNELLHAIQEKIFQKRKLKKISDK